MELPAVAGPTHWATHEDERVLIERAKRDPKAFAALYRQHYRGIAGYVYRRTGDVHATEDLVSEVFLTALRHLPRYRCRGISIRFWLFRIATNGVNRWCRQHHWRSPGGFSEELSVQQPAPSDNGDSLRAQHMQLALLKLAPKHQAVVALHYLEGLSVEQTAAVIGCRVGTVKSRLSRARESLRRQLNVRR